MCIIMLGFYAWDSECLLELPLALFSDFDGISALNFFLPLLSLSPCSLEGHHWMGGGLRVRG
jgi:hypothetical protein